MSDTHKDDSKSKPVPLALNDAPPKKFFDFSEGLEKMQLAYGRVSTAAKVVDSKGKVANNPGAAVVDAATGNVASREVATDRATVPTEALSTRVGGLWNDTWVSRGGGKPYTLFPDVVPGQSYQSSPRDQRLDYHAPYEDTPRRYFNFFPRHQVPSPGQSQVPLPYREDSTRSAPSPRVSTAAGPSSIALTRKRAMSPQEGEGQPRHRQYRDEDDEAGSALWQRKQPGVSHDVVSPKHNKTTGPNWKAPPLHEKKSEATMPQAAAPKKKALAPGQPRAVSPVPKGPKQTADGVDHLALEEDRRVTDPCYFCTNNGLKIARCHFSEECPNATSEQRRNGRRRRLHIEKAANKAAVKADNQAGEKAGEKADDQTGDKAGDKAAEKSTSHAALQRRQYTATQYVMQTMLEAVEGDFDLDSPVVDLAAYRTVKELVARLKQAQ